MFRNLKNEFKSGSNISKSMNSDCHLIAIKKILHLKCNFSKFYMFYMPVERSRQNKPIGITIKSTNIYKRNENIIKNSNKT